MQRVHAMRRFASAVGSAVAGAAVGALAAGPAAAAEGAFVENASANGHGVDELFWLATWSGAVAFAIVVAVLVGSIVAFRERPGHRATYAAGESRRARAFTTVFALTVFLALDVTLAVKDHLVYEEMYGTPPAPGEAIEVECLARQFEWNFRHPGPDGTFGNGDDVRTVKELVVPSDRPTVLRMRSIDVIHSLFLPHFRTKQDVVPGMTTSMVIRPAREGTFDIVCAELCGMAHYDMRGAVRVLPREAFDRWMAEQQAEIAEYGPDVDSEASWRLWESRGGP